MNVMKRRTLAGCAYLLIGAAFARAETYYVAVDGKPTGDGSKDRPWPSVQEALGKVGGGHTILVRPGIYGPIKIPASYSGTRQRPTVVRSEAKWKAKVI